MDSNTIEIIDELFRKGVIAFNECNFYDAHEYWEEIWTEYRLPDAKFIQGMIQLSVGCYHLTNKNLNGAQGLFKKCQNKFADFDGMQRGINVSEVKLSAKQAMDCVNEIENFTEFKWAIIPKLKIN